jgi:hypothetical protein
MVSALWPMVFTEYKKWIGSINYQHGHPSDPSGF